VILVDTSVWVDHLNKGNAALVSELSGANVCVHPWVVGELACGNLRARAQVLEYFQSLPQVPIAGEEEAMFFIEQHMLMGRGIGYVDVHLLASACLSQSSIWTFDKRLHTVAVKLGLAHVQTWH